MLRHLLLAAAAMLALGGAANANPSEQGRTLYEQKCTACHTIGGGDRIGPDLHGVTGRRPQEWLLAFISTPEKMIEAKDEVAVRLYQKYNRIMMPTLGLSEDEVRSLLAYLEEAGAAGGAAPPKAATEPMPRPALAGPQSVMFALFLGFAIVIAGVFAWVARSTRSPTEVDVKKAYGLRRVLFFSASALVLALLAATMPFAPYLGAGVKADRIVHVAARQFEFVFSDEPIVAASDIGRVPTHRQMELAAGSLVEFRVTALDVNHGFGLYGPNRQIVAQVQAMPGYVNRLLVRFDEPGFYKVLCLEYCAAGHHLMQSSITVK